MVKVAQIKQTAHRETPGIPHAQSSSDQELLYYVYLAFIDLRKCLE